MLIVALVGSGTPNQNPNHFVVFALVFKMFRGCLESLWIWPLLCVVRPGSCDSETDHFLMLWTSSLNEIDGFTVCPPPPESCDSETDLFLMLWTSSLNGIDGFTVCLLAHCGF